MQHTAERAKQCGLAEAGDAFEQHMTTGQKTCQHAIDHRLLTDDDLSDFVAHQIEITGGELKRGISTSTYLF